MRLASLCLRIVALVLILAASAAAALAEDSTQRDLTRRRDTEPWLRINAGGHAGTVHALAFTPDSARLCSAGLDKVVQVWNLTVVQGKAVQERTIRWQVARGLRGSIYALASAPSDGLLAMGGYGAMGELGEILLVNPADGNLVKVLEHHQQSIWSLAFSADGNWLASLDTAGGATLWRRGTWKPSTLYDQDRETYGAEKAALIEKQLKLRPIAIAGNGHVILPVFVGTAKDTVARWKLQKIGLADRKDVQTLDTIHFGMVSALAASSDGSRLASADLQGNLYVWDLTRGGKPVHLQEKTQVVSLCFKPNDSRVLIAGTAIDGAPPRGRIQIWDLQTRQHTTRRVLLDHVQACAVSPDGKRLAYSGGHKNEVFVEPLAPGGSAILLQGTARRVMKVAFAKEKPFYRIAFGTKARNAKFNDYADLEESFDTAELALGDEPAQPGDWLSADWMQGTWRAEPRKDGTLQLYRNNVPKGIVKLDAQLPGLDEGAVGSYCWLADAQGKTVAIVVGTNVQNSIYVCRLVEQGTCPILRHFRGHHGRVTSVGVSRDLQYVVSGSFDGTVKVWSLSDHVQGKSNAGRWGARFEVRGNQLVSAKVHPAGPLYRKGMREGDVLDEIIWQAGTKTEKRPDAIRRQLGEFPWGTQVAFKYSRKGAARDPFQLLPAWQPLATLFVNSQREWAFWTPSGYYDASMNGHRLFGWQVNRGLGRLPDFYRADQFYRNLERPDVLERLLSSGSLQAAFRLAAIEPPPELHKVLPQQIAATPRVKIIVPLADTVIRENTTKVRAEIDVPAGIKLVDTKVFTNGVIAPAGKIVEEKDVEGGGKLLTYEWDAPLPRDKKGLIQVVVRTAQQTSAFGKVVIQRDPPAEPPAAKLYVLAVGINQYGDAEIPKLDWSEADANAVVERLKTRTRGLYTVDEVEVLTGEKAVPEFWRESIQRLRKRLKEVAQPDDLLVFFLAGHGVRNEKTEEYHFVGYGAKLRDVVERKIYDQCISWDDFRLLADIPCRKLALLDTCHSGAIQPQRPKNLKTAIRKLQDNVIFTVAASTGKEKALESKELGHGAFTSCLLDAFDGSADESADLIVTLSELVAYVKQAVPKLTNNKQHPTAAPDDWLPYASLPLTQVEKE